MVYAEVCSELADLYIERSDALTQTHQLRYNTIADHIGIEKSITALQEMGKMAAVIPQSSVYRLEGEILAKELERDIIKWILDGDN